MEYEFQITPQHNESGDYKKVPLVKSTKQMTSITFTFVFNFVKSGVNTQL